MIAMKRFKNISITRATNEYINNIVGRTDPHPIV